MICVAIRSFLNKSWNRTKLFARNHKWIVIVMGLLVALVIFITLFFTIGPFAGKKNEAPLPECTQNKTELPISQRLTLIMLAMKSQHKDDFETSVDNVQFIISLSQIMRFDVEAFVVKETCQQVEIKNGTVSGADLDAKSDKMNYDFEGCNQEESNVLYLIAPCRLLAVHEEICEELIGNIERKFPFYVGTLAKSDELLEKLKEIQSKGDH
uniref:Bypass of forespore C C-terminal domain-containing protein n=1 Tax=Panagrolaimus sp. JU765 TaxID=591449 RepID=A0AC34RL81_9BILA